MWEFPKDLPNYPFIILGVLITALCAFAVQRYISRRTAAKSFREGIIDELNSFYPRPGNWPMGFEERLRAAISRIETLVSKFRYFVPRRSQSAYDSDWGIFRSHCLDMTWSNCAAYTMFPSTRSVDDRNPKDVFYENLERLLQYSKET